MPRRSNPSLACLINVAAQIACVPAQLSHWKCTVQPVCEYACVLWEGETTEAWISKLESAQYVLGKAALGVNGNPAAAGVTAELGLVELQFRRQALKLRWDHLCFALRLLSLVFQRRHNEILSGGAQYSGLQSMKDLLLSYGFSEEWLQRRSD